MPDLQTDITLAIAPGCPHCPGLLQVMNELVKRGDIGSLQVVNIATVTDFAEQHHIRSVPWLKIGPFILTGVQSQAEIKQWLARAQSEHSIRDYIADKLTDGELDNVTAMVQQSPDALLQFLPLISDEQTNINVRLGMGAILEELAGNEILLVMQNGLQDLLGHSQARVRGDAAHFLSLLKNPAVINVLNVLQNDPDPEVREIASETITELQALETHH